MSRTYCSFCIQYVLLLLLQALGGSSSFICGGRQIYYVRGGGASAGRDARLGHSARGVSLGSVMGVYGDE